MGATVRMAEANFHYSAGMRLHTAVSGPVDALRRKVDGAEHYGADRLLDDPAPGLRYDNGFLYLTDAPGLGLDADPHKLRTILERTA